MKLFKRNLYPKPNYRMEKRKKKVRDEKESFWSTVILLLAFITWIIYIDNSEKGTHSYYYAHNALFVSCILIIFGILVAARFNVSPLTPIEKLLKKEKLSFPEKEELAWGGLFIVSLYGLLIVDMSFFQNYGFRIGTVVVFSFLKVLRFLLIKKQ